LNKSGRISGNHSPQDKNIQQPKILEEEDTDKGGFDDMFADDQLMK
jgi:hypothetical protein